MLMFHPKKKLHTVSISLPSTVAKMAPFRDNADSWYSTSLHLFTSLATSLLRNNLLVPPIRSISPNRLLSSAGPDTFRSPLASRTFSLMLSTQALFSSLISTLLPDGPARPKKELSSSTQLRRELDLDRPDPSEDGILSS